MIQLLHYLNPEADVLLTANVNRSHLIDDIERMLAQTLTDELGQEFTAANITTIGSFKSPDVHIGYALVIPFTHNELPANAIDDGVSVLIEAKLQKMFEQKGLKLTTGATFVMIDS